MLKKGLQNDPQNDTIFITFAALGLFGPQGGKKEQKVTLLRARGGPRAHFLLDFGHMFVRFFPKLVQLGGINLTPLVPRPELAAGDVNPPRCASTAAWRVGAYL